MDESDTSERIRELLQVTPPNRSRSPRWLLARVKEAVKDKRIGPWTTAPTSGDAALEQLTQTFGGKWVDHRGMVTFEGYELLVTEPYAAEIGREMFDQLEAAVDVLQAAYLFSANSWHFPGQTFRIYVGEHHSVITKLRNALHVPGVSRARVR